MPSKRRLVALAVTASLVMVAGMAGVGQRWLTRSTPVTADEAIERFRAAPVPTPAQAPEAGPHDEGGAPTTPPETGSVTTEATPDAPPPEPVDQEAEPSLVPPEPGVYTYDTEGYEQAGFRRELPGTSQRIITHTSADSFMNHHVFSQEHEDWFELGNVAEGGAMFHRRNRVVFGPLVVDRTIVFDPPIVGVPLPHALGHAWEGYFEGPTSGSYTGRTVDHATIRVGDEDVEVWANELEIRMQGEDEGEVSITLWFSPQYRVMVREQADLTMRGGPATYRSEYTIQLTSTTPER